MPLDRNWREAERAWDQATAAEVAWKRARSASEPFTPDGHLNDRRQAEAVVAAAASGLAGPAWAKTRRLSARPESFPSLDRVQRRLGDLGLDPEVLSASLDLEGLHRQPWRRPGTTPGSAATRAWALARTAYPAKACPDWPDQARRVHEGPRGAWRASSLVACVKSVARMPPARHRKMTQGLLDLKRLSWDLRRFRLGRRRGRTPYGPLGLRLPDLEFWEVLKRTPDELREQLTAARHAS